MKKEDQEQWEAFEYDDWREGTYYVQDKKNKRDICSVDYGETIGEQIDMACRIARLPEVERQRDNLIEIIEKSVSLAVNNPDLLIGYFLAEDSPVREAIKYKSEQ